MKCNIEAWAELLCIVSETLTGQQWSWSYNETMELQVYRVEQ